MKLRFMEGNRTGRLIDVDKEKFIIGRDITCDLMLDEDGISRQHCQIRHEDLDYFIEDMGSTNGIFRNGEKVKERAKLELNDKLRVGSMLLLFTDATGILNTEEMAKIEKVAEKQKVEVQKTLGDAKPKEAGKKTETANKAITAVFVLIMVVLAILLLVMLVAPKDDGGNANGENTGNGLVENPVPGNGGTDVTPPADDDDDSVAADDDDDDDSVAADDDDGTIPDPQDDPPDKRPEPVFRDKITYYWIRSEPAGATVTIDGKGIGQTPYMVMGLEKGTHNLKLSAEGYRELNRVFQIPHGNRFFTYELERKAGSCLITSVPTDMAVLEKGLIIGRTPMLVERAPGDYSFRVSGAGYAPQNIVARVSMAIPTTVKVTMRPSAGTIQLVTLPPGAKAYLDGFFVGQTKAKGPGESAPLQIDGIRSGVHKLHIEYEDAKSEEKSIKIERGLLSKTRMMIYKADTEISTRDRKKYRGMFVRKKANGDLILALRPDKAITVKATNVAQMRAWDTDGE